MQAIFHQLSGLVGLFVFLNQLWKYAPLERAIFVGIATGLTAYLVLLVGDTAVRRILEMKPPTLAENTAGAPSGPEADRRKQDASAKAEAPAL